MTTPPEFKKMGEQQPIILSAEATVAYHLQVLKSIERGEDAAMKCQSENVQ